MTVPAYCITMSSTPERHERALKLFSDLDFPVTFHVADRDPQGGIYGCWRSHLACWDKGVSEGHEIIAIFEDDVEIPSREELLRLLEEGRKAFERQPDLEYICLHGRVMPVGEEEGPVKYGIPITTCAYMVHLPRFLRRGRSNIEPTGKHFDYELYLNPKGPVHTRAGVFEPISGIMPGTDFGTINDYGLFLNTAFRVFGYSNVVDTLDLYMRILRSPPKWFRSLVIVRFNETFVKLLQPVR